jgi:hypothetical protein
MLSSKELFYKLKLHFLEFETEQSNLRAPPLPENARFPKNLLLSNNASELDI